MLNKCVNWDNIKYLIIIMRPFHDRLCCFQISASTFLNFSSKFLFVLSVASVESQTPTKL